MTHWTQQITQYAMPEVERLLVATKSDLSDKRVIQAEQGLQLAQEHGMSFFETSASANHNVQEAFLQITKNIKSRQEVNKKAGGGKQQTSMRSETVKVGDGEKAVKKKKDCC